MRARLVLATALLLSAATTGCFDILNDTNVFPDGTGGGAGTGGTGGTGGATTTTSSVPVECVPKGTSKAVDDSCGIFVSPAGSDDTGEGTQAKPFATIMKALTKGESIYVCADAAKPYEEAVSIEKAGVYLFGALDCETWIYGPAKKTPLTAKSGEVPLKIAGTGTLRIEDFAITAQDAPALGAAEYAAGKSSIAVVAEAGSSLDMARCDVASGKGGDGAPGEPPEGPATTGPDGEDGTGDCDSDQGEFGANGGQNMCGGTDISGGFGGNGTKTASGAAASDGQPAGATGKGGLGQTAAITCDTGGNGANGALGLPGDPGKGATSDVPGTLSATGVVGPSGVAGAAGQPAQGGGGGGGARVCANGKAGPSGGGGGAGGCGGAGGNGGHAGGASIGILSLGASLLFDTVAITTAAGGIGGAGATGQDGGPGGAGGTPGAGDANAIACPGGKGGTGGKGGRGGGGLGGHSIGIAHSGDALITEGAVVTPGTAGPGGMGDGADGPGAAGVAVQVQAF